MKKMFLFTFLTLFALLPVANAEIQTYEGTGEYIMSDFETPDIAKQRAKARAEQNAVEQAGVFVKSYTRTVNSIVTEDEIVAIANTIIKVTKVDYTTTPVNDSGGSFRIVAKIKADVDSARIDAWLKRDAQENARLVEENKQLQQDKIQQDAEIAELRKKLVNVSNEQEKKNLEKDVISADRKFLSNQKVEDGWRLVDKKNFVEAVALFSQAIGLDENNAKAYYGRGFAYREQYNYQQATIDIKKAIEINPQVGEFAYMLLGSLYNIQKNYKAAIDNYTNAIARYPMSGWWVYENRAEAYKQIGDYQSSLNDYNKLINIEDKTSFGFRGRAKLYIKAKKYDLAIKDFDRVIENNPNDDSALTERGCLYSKTGNYNRSIKDLTKSIDILLKKQKYYVPQSFIKDMILEAYMLRGFVHWKFNNTQSAMNDFKMGLSLTETGKLEGLKYYEVLGMVNDIGLSKTESNMCFSILKNGIKQ